MKRNLWLILVFAVLVSMVAAPRLCAAAPPASPPALEDLVSEALEKSEELQALKARIAAAEALVSPAGALPDPMLSVGVSNAPVGTLDLDRTPMSGIDVGLSQKVPAASKRRLRRAVNRAQAHILAARFEDMRLHIARRVKQAYFDVQYLDSAILITQENKILAEDFLATAEARYATGKAPQQDVFRAQVRLSRMVDMLINLRSRRAAARARLNRLLYRDPSQEIAQLPAPQLSTVRFSAAELIPLALQQNPRLAEMTLAEGQAGLQTELAQKGLRPDYTLGFKYRLRENMPMDPVQGDDFWSFSAAINLPWFYREDKVDKEIEAAQAQARAARDDTAAWRNELSTRVAELLIEMQRANEQISLLETGLLPQAEGALSASRAAYATGQVQFLALIDNQINLYNLQIDHARLAADHERYLAELEQLTGGLPATATVGSEVNDAK